MRESDGDKERDRRGTLYIILGNYVYVLTYLLRSGGVAGSSLLNTECQLSSSVFLFNNFPEPFKLRLQCALSRRLRANASLSFFFSARYVCFVHAYAPFGDVSALARMLHSAVYNDRFANNKRHLALDFSVFSRKRGDRD